jgi:hypothetical protein
MPARAGRHAAVKDITDDASGPVVAITLLQSAVAINSPSDILATLHVGQITRQQTANKNP